MSESFDALFDEHAERRSREQAEIDARTHRAREARDACWTRVQSVARPVMDRIAERIRTKDHDASVEESLRDGGGGSMTLTVRLRGRSAKMGPPSVLKFGCTSSDVMINEEVWGSEGQGSRRYLLSDEELTDSGVEDVVTGFLKRVLAAD